MVNSAVKSDHKAYTGSQPNNINKHTMKLKYRLRTSAQHAALLKHVTNVQFEIGSDSEIQVNFDKLDILLDQFYAERESSVTSVHTRFVTPIMKSMLRRKNRLMRSGRLDDASALTKRTHRDSTFCISLPNFIKIGQTVTEISRFL